MCDSSGGDVAACIAGVLVDVCVLHCSHVDTRFECENYSVIIWYGDRGGTVVKVLCYKSEGRWFDPRWCHWNFSLT